MNNKEITRSTDNVFADLGFVDATERQTKTQLALTINKQLLMFILANCNDWHK
ncbi:MAG: hypothetical protein WCK63_17615 [Betaproteobacteria bacterium]|jgi:hypothetical protein